MKPYALLATFVFVAIPLAGCMDVFGGDDYTPRTHEFTLVVAPGSGTPITLYTLNDGSPMQVIAMPFMAAGQQEAAVPNPEIRVKEGDTVILHLENNSPLSHTIHFHGGLIPWEMDGVPYLTQMPVHPGESFTYRFEDLKAGTYMYHCHVDAAHHIDLGMYGAFIVEERDPEHEFDREYVMMLDEWDNCHVHGNTDPITGTEQDGEFSERIDCLYRVLQDNLAQNTLIATALSNQAADPARDPLCDAVEQLPPDVREPLDAVFRQFGCGPGHAPVPPQQEPRQWWPETHPIYNPIYNTFLINGKAFPDTKPLGVVEGERVKVRLINIGEEMHSMHIHGHNMLVTHRDGYLLPAPFRVDTLGIMPGERYDVIIEADNPGFWAFHDHVALHVQNDHHDPGGMFTCFAYDGFHDYSVLAPNGRDLADDWQRALRCSEAAQEIFAGHGHDGEPSVPGR